MAVSTLQRLNIGLIEVSPGLLFLQTELTNEQISISGYLNPVAAFSGVKVNNGDFLFAKASDGSVIYSIIIGANGVISLKGLTPLTFTFPLNSGTSSQILTSDGDNTTSWTGGA